MTEQSYLDSLLYFAPTSTTLTSFSQNQAASGIPYMAARATGKPFADAAFGGKNLQITNHHNTSNMLQDNVMFTPISAMPSADALGSLMTLGPQAHPAAGTIDTSVIADTLAGHIQSVPLPESTGRFTGVQSVLNTTLSVNNIPASIGMGSTNLADSINLMSPILQQRTQYIATEGPVLYNQRSSNLAGYCAARARYNKANQNTRFTMVGE